MNILTTIAQYSTSYDYSTSSTSLTDDEAAAAAVALLAFSGLIFALAIGAYIVAALAMMRIFKKAGVKPWIAWVPFYNNWKMLEIGGQQGFWSVLTIVPFVNVVAIVFLVIAQYHIGKKLGKDGTFVLWAIFVPIVWYIWLAVDKSTWNDAASTAPSLHNPNKA